MENGPTEPTQTSTSSNDTTNTVVLSKKAQKRALKLAKLEERKMERRAKEKAAKKEKKRKRAEKLAAGEQVSEDERSQKRAKAHDTKKPFAARVVLDLGFDDKMSDKVRRIHEFKQEITSLCSQLAYVYSTNRRSPNPFRSLLFTSLNGRTLSRLEKLNDAGYKRWAGTEWWSESYDKLWMWNPTDAVPGDDGMGSGDSRSDEKPEQLPIPVSRDRVVYLTADSSEVLEELKEGETYIIGGICDHNRYKNLCLDKARESGVRAVQLPIGRFLSHLPTRKILTVNQVFEILVKWVETRDWELSLYAVIPKRKFQDGSAHEGSTNEKSTGSTAALGAQDEL